MNITKDDIKQVGFKDESIFIETQDGTVQSMPLRWFSRLERASQEQRERFTLSPFGIHWEELNEDLSFEGFFTYNKDKIKENRSEIEIILSELPFLNLEELGKIANISPALLRHYACGVKKPSLERTEEIKLALRKVGERLLAIC